MYTLFGDNVLPPRHMSYGYYLYILYMQRATMGGGVKNFVAQQSNYFYFILFIFIFTGSNSVFQKCSEMCVQSWDGEHNFLLFLEKLNFNLGE